MDTSVRPEQDGRPSPDHSADAESQACLYAFGVLEGAELVRFERHLAHCARCVQVVDGDRDIVRSLSLTAPEVEPSPDLKDRLLGRAAAELAAPPAERQAIAAPIPIRDTGWRTLRWLLPVAAMLLALLAGSVLLGRQLIETQVVATAPMESTSGQGNGTVLLRRNGEGVIQLRDVGDLRDGRVYQAWVIRPGSAPQATGASTDGDGALTLDGDIRGATVAVTLEPGPGATAPSTQPFLVRQVPV